MVGRSSAEAVNRYLKLMQRAVSCVTGEVLGVGGGYHPSDRPHHLSFQRGDTVRLAGDWALSLQVLQNYRIVRANGSHRVEVVAYFYTVRAEDGRRLIAYHWHPESVSRVERPHLHLGPWCAAVFPHLTHVPFPTGPVSLVELIRFLIEELDIPPLRADWHAALREAAPASEA